MNVRQAALEGGRAALAAFGLPSQPSLSSVGIKAPSIPGVPKPGATPSPLGGGGSSSPLGGSTSTPSPLSGGGGGASGKLAFNVGMGASNSSDGAGAVAGEPTDTSRRQRSVLDRTFQANEDNFATSSMPMPGAMVSP